MSKNKRSNKNMIHGQINLTDMLSLQLVKNDFETICSIIDKNNKNVSGQILSLMLQPYLSLSCLEAINFLNKKRTRINIKNYSSHSVENIRNSLKNSMNRINKIYKNLEEDELEIDSQFSHEVKNQFLQKNNLYYNIGLYVNVKL